MRREMPRVGEADSWFLNKKTVRIVVNAGLMNV